MRILRWAVSLVVVGSSATGASAGQIHREYGAGSYSCRATINLAAGWGHTNCVGSYTTVNTPDVALRSRFDPGIETHSIDASVDYVETGCPLVGTASGTVAIDGSYFADITYMRIGTVAITVLVGGYTGAANGAFTLAAGDTSPDVCSDTDVEITLTGSFGAV